MITFEKVSVGYGGVQVLRQVSVTFPAGTVSALVGPNGCGKSTLLKTADGLLAPTQGRVFLDGVSLKELTRREVARRVAYLPQSRSVGDMTVRQLVLHGRFPYLGYPRRYHREDLEAARQSMEQAGIAALAHRSLNQLSGGERQKAYLAMALAQETDYILLDEPTTYLDAAYQLELMSLAWQLRDRGKAVVLVLHDLNLALRCAQQISLMDQGSILRTGTPEELYRSGQLERVFRIRVGRIQTPQSGMQYYFY